MNRELEFLTYDLGLASALLALKYELVRLNRSNPKKVCFVFKQERNIDDIANAYWNDSLTLPAQEFFNAIKSAKNRLYTNT